MEKMREEFEKWFEDDSFPLEADWFKKDDDGDYYLTSTDIAWSAWKASRSELCVVLPCYQCDQRYKDGVLDANKVFEALEKAGVSYK